MSDIDNLITKQVPRLYRQIRSYSDRDITEKEFRQPVEAILATFAEEAGVNLHQHDEYTLITAGRADTVYNRLIIEYKHPGHLKNEKSAVANREVIKQIKAYIENISHAHHQNLSRLAGIVFDGRWMIFISHVNEAWYEELPVPFTEDNLTRLLKLLVKTSTGVALIPENLIEDFKGLQAQRAARVFYEALGDVAHKDDLTGKLFRQWQTFFGEVTGYEEDSARLKDKKELRKFARDMGINPDQADPPRLFFSIHTYFAILIKLIAWLTLSRYMPQAGPAFSALKDLSGDELRQRLIHMERGGVFRDFYIRNFLEADFFGWYLSAWNKDIEKQLLNVIRALSEYDPETLEVSPEQTRDLLKKLYHYLMPRELRHDLGEYYTPDWLAERLLQQLDTVLFQPLDNPNALNQTLAYARKQLLKLRFLDPACGSGTFLVLIISRFRQLAKLLNLSDLDVLNALQRNVVGIDLNPLAAIASRTNYLLALGDMLTLPGRGVITIPVYLADSIVPPSLGRTLEDAGTFPIPTTVGRFRVPEVFGTRQRLDLLTQTLDDAVDKEIPPEAFLGLIQVKLDLPEDAWENTERPLTHLYTQLLDLHRHGLNGVWARIIRNAFAPLFIGKFDYSVGNPPWVNWENLPPDYRESSAFLWDYYSLFPPRDSKTRLQSDRSKADLSVLMTYVAMDKYLNRGGRLGFVITQSIFKSESGGRGFRIFNLPYGEGIGVIHVDDLNELQPFEGATNRTAVVILERGKATKYPIPYLYWKKLKEHQFTFDSSLQDVLDGSVRIHWVAEPIDESDKTSPWITGKKKALEAMRRYVGSSIYHNTVREGVNTRGASGMLWVELIGMASTEGITISNIPEAGRIDIPKVHSIVEQEFVYPLVRGRELEKWFTNPQFSIILPYDSQKNPGIPLKEAELFKVAPKTFNFLSSFREFLMSRGKFRNFDPSLDPFYCLYNVGKYTFSPYKVGWRYVSTDMSAAVFSSVDHPVLGNKLVIPDHKIMIVPFTTKEEAHFVCSMLNSSPASLVVRSYTISTQLSTHILQRLNIPVFNNINENHKNLSNLSQIAHVLAAQIHDATSSQETIQSAQIQLKQVEAEINHFVAQLWGLTDLELEEIKKSLEELG